MRAQILVLGSLLVLSTGCRKKAPEATLVETPVQLEAPAPAAIPAEVLEQMAEHFSKVHFELDKAELSEASMDALSENAKLMQKYPRLTIEVQGHADERGTTDYNLALGTKRAEAVARYLGEMGVADARIRRLSYGEERPADSTSNEVAWSANRRCEFRILTPQPGVQGTTER